jgi:serine protease Do
MTVIRYGEEKILSVKLEARDDEESVRGNTHLWPGLVVQKITPDIRDQLDIPGSVTGVVIGGVVNGSSAYIAGFRQGDIITKINNRKIGTLLDFYRQLNTTGSQEITFRIYRENREILLGLVK